jgi:hypothetical protein
VAPPFPQTVVSIGCELIKGLLSTVIVTVPVMFCKQSPELLSSEVNKENVVFVNKGFVVNPPLPDPSRVIVNVVVPSVKLTNAPGVPIKRRFVVPLLQIVEELDVKLAVGG